MKMGKALLVGGISGECLKQGFEGVVKIICELGTLERLGKGKDCTTM